MNAIVPRGKHNRSLRLCWFVILPLLLLIVPPSFAQDTVVTLTLGRLPIVGSPPVTESFILTTPFPPASPTAVLILLPGGNGDIHLTPVGSDGTLGINSSNFLTRDRGLFAGHNFIVITLDAASDYLLTADILKFHQGDADHISDVEAVILWARTAYPGLPVWLVGTSRGTAGAFVAASAPPTGPDGLVFSSAINNTTDPDSLLLATLSSITVPVLLLNDSGNTCPGTLASGDPAVKKALKGSPAVSIVNISPGGLAPLTDSCNPFSDHGYFGREPQAVAMIAAFIIAH